MLHKKNRLPASFFRFKTKPQKIFHNDVLRIATYKPQTNVFRAAVVISKKVDKLATRRNHLRRIVMEVMQKQQQQIPIMDYVILLQKKATEISKEELVNEVEKILL